MVTEFHRLAESAYFILFARTLLGLMFLATGIGKIEARDEFIETIRDYELLPRGLARLVGWMLPWGECVIAVGLLSGGLMPWSALAAVGLLFLLSGAAAINLLRGRRNLACGCFGAWMQRRLTWATVGQNGIFAGLAAVTAMAGASPLMSSQIQALSIGGEVVVVLAAGAVVTLWWLWDQLLALHQLPES